MLEATTVHPYGSFWLDFADKAIKGAAVVIGGVWTYVIAVRSGTFRRKLEPEVSARLFKAAGTDYVEVTCGLKNVGQTNYPIRQRGTAVEIVPLSPDGRKDPIINAVFTKHGWIEPGEAIREQLIFPIPPAHDFVAFEVNLRIVSEAALTKSAVEWNATCVVSEYLDGGTVSAVAAEVPGNAQKP